MTLALIFAAGGLLLGLGIAWRRFEVSRELRTHERFARAVEQLASDRSDGSPRTTGSCANAPAAASNHATAAILISFNM